MKCQICKKDKLTLDNHHIQSKKYGGKDLKYNIVEICPNCHRAVHLGLLIIEGWFGSTEGRTLVWRKLGQDSITGIKEPEVYIIPNSENIRKKFLERNKL